jgi:hypothetical protein
MDKQERGFLLVEQEDTEKELKDLRDKLIDMGKHLVRFGSEIASNPVEVSFANAPSGLDNLPSTLLSDPSFDWNTIPDKETIARLIQELRQIEDRLKEVHRRLDSQ